MLWDPLFLNLNPKIYKKIIFRINHYCVIEIDLIKCDVLTDKSKLASRSTKRL